MTGVVAFALSLPLTISGLVVAFFTSRFNLLYRIKHRVDTKSKKHGGELVAEILASHDVNTIFTLPGGHISPITVACEKQGMRIVDTRHEVTAAFAADGFARIGRSIGVVIVTAGPGLTNVVTAIKNAQMAESPVILIGGASAVIQKGRGALQDIDQMSLFKSVCKQCLSVTKVRDIISTLREAIRTAQSGVPGPVFIELPVDVLYPYSVVRSQIGIRENPKTVVQKAVNLYLNNYLGDLFAGAFEPQDVEPLPIIYPTATDQLLQICVQLVSTSKKPVILVGSQSMLPMVPIPELVVALESLGIPCFLGGMARGLLGRNNPIHIRQGRSKVLKEADLVILAGTVCDFRLDYGRSIGKQAKIIAVNRGEKLLKQNSDVFWKPTVAIVGDSADFLVRLQASLPGYKCDPDWTRSLKAREVAIEQQNFQKSLSTPEKYLNPMQVLFKLEEVMDDNAIIVADGGDFVATAAYILRPRGPLQWLDPGPFGTLGVGAGFAMGARLARPDAQVWIVYGDGSLGYSIIEYDTYRRFNIPIMSVVGNDACWTQIVREQQPMLGSRVGCDLEYSSYEKVVEALGGHGEMISDCSTDQISEALVRMKEESNKGKPGLLNCLIGTTDFREGSISV